MNTEPIVLREYERATITPGVRCDGSHPFELFSFGQRDAEFKRFTWWVSAESVESTGKKLESLSPANTIFRVWMNLSATMTPPLQAWCAADRLVALLSTKQLPHQLGVARVHTVGVLVCVFACNEALNTFSIAEAPGSTATCASCSTVRSL